MKKAPQTPCFVIALCHFALLGSLLFTSSCSPTRSPSAIEQARSSKSSAIIFIPGYKGSMLADTKSGQTVWINASEIFFGNTSLAIDTPSIDVRNPKDFTPIELFKAFTVIPALYSYAIYEDWLRFLKSNLPPDSSVIEFPYDWRQDLATSASHLKEVIEELHKHQVKDISVIAHSMGSLILAYYLRYGGQPIDSATETWEGSQKVKRVVFAGAPFLGSIAIFRDFQRGNPASLNTILLSREALATFYSSYQLLPSANLNPLLEKNLAASNKDLFLAKDWQFGNWGLFHSEAKVTSNVSAKLEFLQSRLSRAKRFNELLHAPIVNQSHNRPLARVIISEGRPTAARALLGDIGEPPMFAQDEGVRDEVKNHLIEDGDLLVTKTSAQLPGPFAEVLNEKVWSTRAEHADIYDDPQIRHDLIEFLKASTSANSEWH